MRTAIKITAWCCSNTSANVFGVPIAKLALSCKFSSCPFVYLLLVDLHNLSEVFLSNARFLFEDGLFKCYFVSDVEFA